MATDKKSVLIRLQPKIHEQLKNIAAGNKRTVTNQVEYWIGQQIENESRKNSVDSEKTIQAKITTLNQSGGKNEVNTK